MILLIISNGLSLKRVPLRTIYTGVAMLQYSNNFIVKLALYLPFAHLIYLIYIILIKS